MVFVIAIESRDHETDGRASKCSLNEQDRTTIRVQERHKTQIQRKTYPDCSDIQKCS